MNPSRLAAEMESEIKLQLVDDTPDLLVSGFGMPGMDGRQPAGTLKGRGRTSGLSVILVATQADVSAKLTGDAAVFQVLECGNFQINFEAKTGHDITTLNIQGLIEGLRLADGARRDPGGKSEEEEDVLLDS
jgi:CheY-like chemotaxis protein